MTAKQAREEIYRLLNEHPDVAKNWVGHTFLTVSLPVLLQKLEYIKRKIREKEKVS